MRMRSTALAVSALAAALACGPLGAEHKLDPKLTRGPLVHSYNKSSGQQLRSASERVARGWKISPGDSAFNLEDATGKVVARRFDNRPLFRLNGLPLFVTGLYAQEPPLRGLTWYASSGLNFVYYDQPGCAGTPYAHPAYGHGFDYFGFPQPAESPVTVMLVFETANVVQVYPQSFIDWDGCRSISGGPIPMTPLLAAIPIEQFGTPPFRWR